jgi:hypothetical protein
MKRKGILFLVMSSLVLLLIAPVAYGEPVDGEPVNTSVLLFQPMGHGDGGF